MLTHRVGPITDLLYRTLQLFRRHLELPGPISKLVLLANVDASAIRRTGLALVVCHDGLLSLECSNVRADSESSSNNIRRQDFASISFKAPQRKEVAKYAEPGNDAAAHTPGIGDASTG